MSRRCELTGRGPTTGNLVSHSNVKTRTRWLPNLHRKRYRIPETGEVLTLRLSASAIRDIDKAGGISAAVLRAPFHRLSDRLAKIRRAVEKKRSRGK